MRSVLSKTGFARQSEVVSLLTGFVRNAGELIALRFLLGVAEGGIYPALLIVISKWFPARELGRANAIFLTSLPLSTVLTNPLSGWIVSRYDWRWMFFLEGGLSLLLVLLWLPMISDHPGEAKWISPEERAYLDETLASERFASERQFQSANGTQWSYKQLLADKNLWLMVPFIIQVRAAARSKEFMFTRKSPAPSSILLSRP